MYLGTLRSSICRSGSSAQLGAFLFALLAACTPRSAQLPEGAPARFTVIDRSEFPNGDCTTGTANTLRIGPRTLTLRRQDTAHDVVVVPDEWPFDVQVAVVAQDAPLLVSFYLRQEQLLRPPGLGARIADPGTIVLLTSTSFLDRVDDDELTWALAHEVAHVVLGHLTRKPTLSERVGTVLSAVMSPILIVPIAGAVVTSAVTETASGIRRRSNRDQERDADRLGTTIACAAGIDAGAGPRLMEAMSKGPQASSLRRFFDEHPSYDERAELIRASAASACKAAPDR